MIEIKKINDIALAKSLCEEKGLDWSDDLCVIATIEKEAIINIAIFSYKDDAGEIHLIEGFGDDLDMLDGLCRAILNIMDINGVKYVYLSEKHPRLAQKVGFEPNDGRFSLNLEGFFGCCCCNK